MINKKYLIFLIFLISLMTISFVSASDNIDDKISNVEETDNGLTLNEKLAIAKVNESYMGETENSDENSLYYLNGLISSQENNNLTLINDFRYNEEYDRVYENGILIDKNNFILDGNNHVIDGGHKNRIFNITATGVTLKNIKFINAFASHGSTVYGGGENLSIINCTFENNNATEKAAAIYLNAINAHIYNSIFINNTAKTGGAVYALNASSFISNSHFAKNDASSSAGAVRLDGGNATIEDCIFENNVGDYGGAFYTKDLNEGIILNCIFTNNSAQTTGGAFESSKSKKLLLNNTTFKANRALTNNGGAVYLHGANINILSSKFIGNVAKINGGAVYSTSSSDWTIHSDDGIISNCLFENNTAGSIGEGQGGALNWNGQRVLITYSNFTSNYANDSGAIDVLSRDGNINHCIFKNNKATTGGAGAINVEEANFRVADCDFINSYSSTSAGSIYWLAYAENGTVINCKFVNSTSKWGGAIRWQSAKNGKVINSTFINCTGKGASTDLGGALYWRSANNGQITDCNFVKCSSGIGGSIYNTGKNLTINNCNFTNPYAIGTGLSISTSGDDVTISKCNFINASANTEFTKITGVIDWNSNGIIRDCTVNQSNTTYSLYIDGFYNLDGMVYLENNKFDKPIHLQDGNIKSPTFIQILENATYSVYEDNILNLQAVVKDNSGNDIISKNKLIFILSNGTELTATLNGTLWQYAEQFTVPGNYSILAKLKGLDNVSINTSEINVIKVFDIPENITAGEDVNVTVILPNSTFTGDAVLIYDGEIKGNIKMENGSANFTIEKITGGKHSINIVKTNENNESEILSKIFNVDKLANKIEVNVNPNVTVGEDVVVYISNPNLPGELITLTSDIAETQTVRLYGRGYIYVHLPNAIAGDHYVTIISNGNDFYNATTVTVPFTVNKKTAKVNVTIGEITPEGYNVTVSIPDASGNVSVIVDGVENIVPLDENGTAIYTIPEVTGGYHSVVVIYDGDDTYNGTRVAKTLYNEEFPTEFTNVTIAEGKLTCILSLPSGDGLSNAIVTVTVNDTTFNITTDVNGLLTVEDVLGKVVELTYAGNGTLLPAKISIDLTDMAVPELLNPELKLDIQNTTIIVSINENATGDVIITVGDISFVQNADELNPIDVSKYLTNGTYSVTVRYVGDKNFTGSMIIGGRVTVPEEPIIEPKDPQLKASAVNNTITVSVDKDATGNVLVDVDGQGYYAPIKNGQATVNVIGLDEGEYTATVTYVGDEVFKAANTTVSVTVPKKEDPTPEPIDPKAKIEITNTTVNITVLEDATGFFLVDVDGIGYYTTIKDGKANIDLPKLTHGNHTIMATYTGDNKYRQANATETITIEEEIETIVAQDLIKVEKAPDRFEATFNDANGKALANVEVTFTINGVTYTRTTDTNGKASIAINLEVGKYIITIKNTLTNETKEQKITVLSRFAENNDLTKYFRNASQYIIKILDDDGNPAKEGEIVTFNIHGVFYNRTANATGHVQLNINLNPGDYIITAEYKGCKVSNNIKVLPTLTGKDLTKKYGETDAYEATLVDGQGKPYANQKIDFNINGVLYKRMTDSRGVAKLNINLQPGKYIITASYGYAVNSNTITITA